MTKQLRYMLMGIAFLALGAWGAALALVGIFFYLIAILAPIAGIICIVISFLEYE